MSSTKYNENKMKLQERLTDSKLKKSNRNRNKLNWFSSARSRRGKPVNYDIRENPNAASRASTRIRFDDDAEIGFSKSNISRQTEESSNSRPTSFLGFSKTLKRKRKKKDDTLREMVNLFNDSNFEFEVDDADLPENIDMHDKNEEAAKEQLMQTNVEDQSARCNIRDTYLTSAEESRSPKKYSKHLSISSAPNLKFSMISTAPLGRDTNHPVSLESVPLPPEIDRLSDADSDEGAVKSI